MRNEWRQYSLPPAFGRTRFAPSPTGWLHQGHARALLVASLAGEWPGTGVHIRLEDLDSERCRPHYVQGIARDLAVLGVQSPPWVWQSRRGLAYRQAMEMLHHRGVIYPCWCSRRDLEHRYRDAGDSGLFRPKTPDNAWRYDGFCRQRFRSGEPGGKGAPRWRLDALRALAYTGPLWAQEFFPSWGWRKMALDLQAWGDIVVQNSLGVATYHLAVVVDDAALGVSLVTRGQDLQASTAVHCALQRLLKLPSPRYYHHPLITDHQGQKLSKSRGDPRLADDIVAGKIKKKDLWRDAERILCPQKFAQESPCA